MDENMYTGFAGLYDTFMDNIPYDDWTDYLVGLLWEYGVSAAEGEAGETGRSGCLVLDLGCGTGNITERLAARGFDMIGIDNSEDMLSAAMDKAYESGSNALYLLQDMREFELYGTVRAVVCICDSINYILEKDELVKVFSLVNNYLDPGGIFIFDMTTEVKYNAIGDKTIAENREEGSFIWENMYFSDEKINRYDLTIFARRDDELYEKYEETHIQRVYGVEETLECLKMAGLEPIAAYDAFTKNPPGSGSERIYFIARETGK